MRFLLLLYCLPFVLDAQTIQLSPPHIKEASVFFKTKSKVRLEFDLAKASIQYAFQDSITQHASVYKKPIFIRESGTLKVRATHPDFLSSEVLEMPFIKVRHSPNKLSLLTSPHEKYPGNGAETLYDLKKGMQNLHDGSWLGFLSDTIAMEIFFHDKKYCKELMISTLMDNGAWILPPREIAVYGKNNQLEWQKLGYWKVESAAEPHSAKPNYATFISIKLEPLKTREIRIEVLPWGLLPQGHPGAGSPAWLFLDEIVFQ